jgi:Cu/Ag efflux protein CusF
MKKIIAAVVVLPFLAVSGNAIAEEIQGKIKEMNSWSITLTDGNFYSVGNSTALEGLKPGDEVKVTFERGGESQEDKAHSIQKVDPNR